MEILKSVCVCVCGPPDGPISGPRAPLWAAPIVPGSTDLTGIFPLARVSQPPPRLRLDSSADPSLTPEGPHLQGVLIQGWGRGQIDATGLTPTLESACATGWYLSDTCWRTCQLSTLIPSASELMLPGTRMWRNHLMLRTRPQATNHPRRSVSLV